MLFAAGKLNAQENLDTQADETSLKFLTSKIPAVHELIAKGKVDDAERILKDLRVKAASFLEDGRLPEEQPKTIKILRSNLLNTEESLLFKRGDFKGVVKSASQHMRLLASINDPQVIIRESETVWLLIGACKQTGDDTRPWIKQFVKSLSLQNPQDSVIFADQLQQLAQDAKSARLDEEADYLAGCAVKMIQSTTPADDYAQLLGLTYIARVHFGQNKLSEAEAVLPRARILAKKTGKEGAERLMEILAQLSTLHASQSGAKHVKKHEEYLQESSDLAKQHGLGSSDLSRLRLDGQARSATQNGELLEAIEIKKKSWKLAEARWGKNHPSTMEDMTVYAITLENAGKLQDALMVRKDLLDLTKTNQGELHPLVAEAQHALGRVYYILRQYEESEKCYDRAAGIRERSFGAEHGETAKSYFNIGLIREAKGDFAGSSAYYGHVLKIDQKAHGINSEVVASDTAALARSLMLEGRHDESLKLLRNHIVLLENALGKDHQILCVLLDVMASTQAKCDNFAEAETLYQRVINLRHKDARQDLKLIGDSHAYYGVYLVSRHKLTLAAEQMRTAVIHYARQGMMERSRNPDLSPCIEFYVNILRRLQYDEQTIQSHANLLEKGIDPVEIK